VARVAVIDKDLCRPKNCSLECIVFCPLNRDGGKCITLSNEDRSKAKAAIDENICNGCSICVKKCPFEAITIVKLAEELEEHKVHQYGKNSFRLYNLPIPKSGAVVGLLGRNGIGKSTVISILSGTLKPNLGEYEDEPTWDEVIEHFRGTMLKDYFTALMNKQIKVSIKPQQVYHIAKVFKGTAKELLEMYDEDGHAMDYAKRLDLNNSLERYVNELSGGELQRLAIAVACSRDADFYFFDEPSSYNDIYQRLNAARVIHGIAKERSVMIVEHDLTMIDYLCDYIHVLYGEPSVYGIVSDIMSTKSGVNEFLSGYLTSINVRFRDKAFRFSTATNTEGLILDEVVAEYTVLEKSYAGSFRLVADAARIRKGEVLCMIGANALGKTTLMKMLAGVEMPDRGSITLHAKVSYKPQYLEDIQSYEYDVRTLLSDSYGKAVEGSSMEGIIVEPLSLRKLYDKQVKNLSGGELQRVAVASCLLRDADIYALDEPSAFLDVEDRIAIARFIQRFVKGQGKSAVVIDHDIHLIDMVADTIVLFRGRAGIEGNASRVMKKHEGMNLFLKELDVTFRRDDESNRARINKIDSRLDREQRVTGLYYAA
jgi:ATP-binding cassette subfamily E protein 1